MSKNLFRLIPSALSACIACVFAVSTQAGSATLDFDAVSDGAIVSDGTSSTGIYSGISISALNTGGGPNLAVAYDSGAPSVATATWKKTDMGPTLPMGRPAPVALPVSATC